jgi:hypothetical protein
LFYGCAGCPHGLAVHFLLHGRTRVCMHQCVYTQTHTHVHIYVHQHASTHTHKLSFKTYFRIHASLPRYRYVFFRRATQRTALVAVSATFSLSGVPRTGVLLQYPRVLTGYPAWVLTVHSVSVLTGYSGDTQRAPPSFPRGYYCVLTGVLGVLMRLLLRAHRLLPRAPIPFRRIGTVGNGGDPARPGR